jgi:hypothetical protein
MKFGEYGFKIQKELEAIKTASCEQKKKYEA